MEEDVFSTGVTELEDVLFFQFHVAFGLYLLVVDIGTVGGFEVNDVRDYTTHSSAPSLKKNFKWGLLQCEKH